MFERIIECLDMVLFNVEDGAIHGGQGPHALDLGVDVLRHVATQDRPDEANALEGLALHTDLVRDELFLAVEERPSGHFLLVTARNEGKGLQQSRACVAVALSGELIGCGLEEVEQAGVDGLELLDRIFRGGLDDVTGLWNADCLEIDSGGSLDALDLKLLPHGPESDACSGLSGAGRPARTMNVGLGVLGWLDLDD